ncbi:hypothetical protein VNI00_012680 [Paramarasmius palmivorus]|uniref:Uncharacterized protein n=1 Tax=Paramarasmius palmivorus TaxID=297713 RepID=A0AAW0C3V7_9AGAR
MPAFAYTTQAQGLNTRPSITFAERPSVLHSRPVLPNAHERGRALVSSQCPGWNKGSLNDFITDVRLLGSINGGMPTKSVDAVDLDNAVNRFIDIVGAGKGRTPQTRASSA